MGDAIKILILEHDPNDLELLHYALKKTGLPYISEEVQTRETYQHALAAFCPDIILSDFSLPTFDGLSAFKVKQEVLPAVPFIIVSGTIGDENAVELIKSGVTDYVLKEKLYQIGPKIERALKEAEAKKEKEQAELQLRKSEEHFRKIMDLSLDLIFTLDQEGRMLTISPAAKLILDYHPEELAGRQIMELIHEEDQEKTIQAFENLKYGIDIINHESRYLRRSGTPVTMLWSVRWHSDNIGYGIAKEITEIKKAQEELIRKKKQLKKAYLQNQNLLESITEGFFAADKNWTVTYWNKAAERLLLTPKENIQGKNLWDVFPAAVNTQFYPEYHRVIAEQVPVTFEEYFPPLDSWYEVTASPSKDGLTGFFKDVTEIKQAQEKVRMNERRFRTLLQNSTDGLSLLAPDGIILERSPAALKILELNPDEVSGPFHQDLVHPEDRALLLETCDFVKKNPTESRTIEYRFLTPGGTYKWIETTFNNQLHEPAINAIVLNFRDITNRKQSELALKKSEFILRKGEGIAHLGSWQEDLKLGKTIWSEETYKILGLTPFGVEPSANLYFSFVHPEDRLLVKRHFVNYRANQLNNSFSHRIIRHDGEIRYVLSDSKYEFDPVSKETMLYGVLLDITDQKLAEEQLKNSEARLKEAQAIGKIGNWEVNFATGKSEWSDEVFRIYGLKKGTVVQSPEMFVSFVHPEDREMVLNKVRATQPLLQDGSASYRFFRKNGEMRYGYSEWRFKADKQGKPISMHGIIQDITDKKLAELALIESEEKYRHLFEISPLPMWVYDVETYRFLNVNAAACRHYGYSKADFLAMTVNDIRPAEDLPKLEQTVKNNLRSGTFYRGIFNHLKRNGQLIQVEIQSNQMTYEGRPGRLVLARDISERLKYTQAIEEQNRKLREIAWLQSHVVRAPLSRIMGLISLLDNYSETGKNVDTLTDHLKTSAHELDAVIRNIIKETEQVEKQIPE